MHNDGDLAKYLLSVCGSQNLTMRQASIRSGLDPSTIAKIVRRNHRDGGGAEPSTLQALADNLGADFQRMMVLAGHLDPPIGVDSDEDLEYDILRLQELYRRLRRISPDAASRLVAATLAQASALLEVVEPQGEGRTEAKEKERV